MQWFQLALKRRPEGCVAITALIGGLFETVREWSTENAPAWDPDVALEALRAQVTIGGQRAFSAEIVMREHVAGRLETAWTPKGRPPPEFWGPQIADGDGTGSVADTSSQRVDGVDESRDVSLALDLPFHAARS